MGPTRAPACAWRITAGVAVLLGVAAGNATPRTAGTVAGAGGRVVAGAATVVRTSTVVGAATVVRTATVAGAAVVAGAAARAIPVATAASFQQALRPRAWVFPRDHGAHPSFQTEWWYFTGIVRDQDGKTLGYELTFFRFGLAAQLPPGASAWRARDLILAHLAVTDVQAGRFGMEERVQRAALALAGADTAGLHVWLGDWQAVERGGGFALQATRGDLAVDVELVSATAPVLHGEQGLSRKTETGDQASYYYSLPKLATRGRIRVAGSERAVEGMTWMDHEFFTGATPEAGLGWDWFSARLDDGRDVMLYVVVDSRGDRHASGTLIERDGASRPLDVTGLVAQPLRTWRSPRSGATYPVAWRLELPVEGALLAVDAALDAQEVLAERSAGFAYWEGLSRFRGTWRGQPVAGEGYVELTGYDRGRAGTVAATATVELGGAAPGTIRTNQPAPVGSQGETSPKVPAKPPPPK
jgi:predicted secreted hydrolase